MNRLKDFSRLTVCFTIPIAVLMAACSGLGVWDRSLYARETADWLSQCVGQDLSNLLCVIPTLLVSAFLAAKGSRGAKIVWVGAMITNIYSYIIYCFSVHFNYLFHLYCLILGLSVYAVICFAIQNRGSDYSRWFSASVKRMPAAVLLIAIAVLFSLLWLSQTIPAVLQNSPPQSIVKDAVPTNPIYVLDFSFYIPLLFISSILLIRNAGAGYFLAPMMLVFGIITNVNIISLTGVTAVYTHSNQAPMLILFSVFTVVCFVFLLSFLKGVKKAGRSEKS